MSALQPGRPYPLGACVRDGGVNFAVFSEHATALDLVGFDARGQREIARHRLPACSDGVWHGFLPGAAAGLVYGLRAHGDYRPEAGHRFNHHKLLLDPYAREIVGELRWRDEHFGYRRGAADSHRSFDARDNAAFALKARVVADGPQRPRVARAPVPRADVLLYELHVKGFTRRHPDVPPPLRGTFAGLGHAAAIAHLQALGITTVSLQPVHYALTEERLVELGLVNYWGYNTIGYFCPDPRLSSTPTDPAATRAEFRAMVDALHAAGLEVLIDVVFNHTAEGSELGPTLSLRGLDNSVWYRLQHGDRARYNDVTGCGNTVNVGHPRVTQFVLDVLRYWVDDMGVDGFRFDLAPVLGRTAHGFDPLAPFFVALLQDPVLARARLVAEPWDLGPGGYQLGRFPDRFLEWNDRFRDGMRQFWLTRGVDRAEFARRLLASSDRFCHGRRAPTASVNYIASHDGPTLHDLVTYARKHNQANGENNHDGQSVTHSINCGVEGETAAPAVNRQRLRLKRALLATLLLAQGTPMLLAGDEFGRTQRGNTNAYCQDNETSWIDWPRADRELRDFVAQLARLRKAGIALARDRWYSAQPHGDGRRDAIWLAPEGREMSVDDWHDRQRHCIGVRVAAPAHPDALLIFNAETDAVGFDLPAGRWRVVLDSSGDVPLGAEPIAAHARYEVPAQSVLALLLEPSAADRADGHA